VGDDEPTLETADAANPIDDKESPGNTGVVENK
jgi:hypothetical protein